MAFIIDGLLTALEQSSTPTADQQYIERELRHGSPLPVIPSVVESGIVNHIEPCLNRGPWIVGGAPLRWYQKQSIAMSDIDIFVRSEDQKHALIKRLTKLGARQHHVTPNALTFKITVPDAEGTNAAFRTSPPAEVTVQVITKKYYSDLEEIFEFFDISVCKIATDGYSFKLGPDAAKDIRSRTLRFDKVREDSFKRLVKYTAYGYNASSEEYQKVVDNISPESVYFTWSESGDYDAI